MADSLNIGQLPTLVQAELAYGFEATPGIDLISEHVANLDRLPLQNSTPVHGFRPRLPGPILVTK